MRILILKTSALGDIVHAFTVVDFLRHRFPQAQIDWVVESSFSSLVHAHPYVNHVIEVNTRAWRKDLFSKKTWNEIKNYKQCVQKINYDVVFDLQGNIKSSLLLAFVKAKHKVGFTKDCVPEWPNLFFTNKRYHPPASKNIREDYLFLAQSYFNDRVPFQPTQVLLSLSAKEEGVLRETCKDLPENTLLVCPGAHWTNKQLSFEALLDFLQHLQSQYHFFFLLVWGTEKEKESVCQLYEVLKNSSRVLDKLPLPVLQHLMARVGKVLAMDSLPLHLAGVANVPTFSIFGPSSAKKYQPLGESHVAYQGSCPFGYHFEKRCDQLRTCSTGGCIKHLKVRDLDHAASALFNRAKKN